MYLHVIYFHMLIQYMILSYLVSCISFYTVLKIFRLSSSPSLGKGGHPQQRHSNMISFNLGSFRHIIKCMLIGHQVSNIQHRKKQHKSSLFVKQHLGFKLSQPARHYPQQTTSGRFSNSFCSKKDSGSLFPVEESTAFFCRCLVWLPIGLGSKATHLVGWNEKEIRWLPKPLHLPRSL